MVAHMVEERCVPMEAVKKFLVCKTESESLTQTVNELSESLGTLYRGVMYLKTDLKKGQIYKHWNEMSSWSRKEEIAKTFAFYNCIPEGLVEKAYKSKYGEYKSWCELDERTINAIEDEFVSVVLVDDAGVGFYVNRHYPENEFSNEDEVIVHQGEWVIETIEECICKNGLTYYQVRVKRV